jgi:hypothetical protein
VTDRIKSSGEQIVHGGGWSKQQIVGRPKARFFGFLSIVSLSVSAIASMAFWPPDHPLLSFQLAARCVCGVLVALQAVFALVAVMFLIFEKPRKFIVLGR